MKEIRPFYESDLVKIITGIRRCGKSVIIKSVFDEMPEKTDDILCFDFEDASTLKDSGTVEKLLSFVEQNRKKGKCCIFLDEVQNVKDRAIAVKTLRLHNNSVFISGSNSKLLSKEFATEFSGRYVSFRIRLSSIRKPSCTPRNWANPLIR